MESKGRVGFVSMLETMQAVKKRLARRWGEGREEERERRTTHVSGSQHPPALRAVRNLDHRLARLLVQLVHGLRGQDFERRWIQG